METSGAHTIKDALSDLANSKHTEAGHSNILQGLAGVVSVGLSVAGLSRDRKRGDEIFPPSCDLN